MKKILRILLLTTCFFALIFSASAFEKLEIYPTCDNKGSLHISLHARELPFDLEMDDIEVKVYLSGVEHLVSGIWDSDLKIRKGVAATLTRSFESEEIELLNKGNYEARLYYLDGNETKYIKSDFLCPGYYFSCHVLNVSIDECSNINGQFSAKFRLSGTDNYKEINTSRVFNRLNNIRYTFRTRYRYIDQLESNSTSGSIPKGYFLYETDSEDFTIKWRNNENYVESVSIQVKDVSECLNKERYPLIKTSDTVDCTIEPTEKDKIGPCPKGCEYYDACLPFGTRFSIDDNQVYCTENKEIKSQIGALYSCLHDYQCESDFCDKGECSRYSKSPPLKEDEPPLKSAEDKIAEKKEEAPPVKEGLFKRLFGWLFG